MKIHRTRRSHLWAQTVDRPPQAACTAKGVENSPPGGALREMDEGPAPDSQTFGRRLPP